MDDDKIILDKVKRIYTAIQVTDESIETGWKNIHYRLTDQVTAVTTNTTLRSYRQYWFAAALAVFLIFAGTANLAQAAKPGDILYPIKAFSENAFNKITRKPVHLPEQRVGGPAEEFPTGFSIISGIKEPSATPTKKPETGKSSAATRIETPSPSGKSSRNLGSGQRQNNSNGNSGSQSGKGNGQVQGAADLKNGNDANGNQKNSINRTNNGNNGNKSDSH